MPTQSDLFKKEPNQWQKGYLDSKERAKTRRKKFLHKLLVNKTRENILDREFKNHLERAFETLEIFNAIDKQPFLKGESPGGWKLGLDWLIENDTNYLKVLELNYIKGDKK